MQVLGIGAVAYGAVAMALFGTGTATAAPDVVGQTYSDAREAIEEEGGSVVVASRMGDKLAEDYCVVINAWDASFVRIDAFDEDQVQVALNRAGEYATATDPGASIANPLGRAAKSNAEQEAAEQEEQQLAEASTPDE